MVDVWTEVLFDKLPLFDKLGISILPKLFKENLSDSLNFGYLSSVFSKSAFLFILLGPKSVNLFWTIDYI